MGAFIIASITYTEVKREKIGHSPSLKSRVVVEPQASLRKGSTTSGALSLSKMSGQL